jgi:hypothetical protein
MNEARTLYGEVVIGRRTFSETRQQWWAYWMSSGWEETADSLYGILAHIRAHDFNALVNDAPTKDWDRVETTIRWKENLAELGESYGGKMKIVTTIERGL